MLLPDGTNINHALVKKGWCWWYRKYTPVDTELEKLETEAQRGLCACPAPRTAVEVAKEREKLIRSPFCWWSRFALELSPYKFSRGGTTGTGSLCW